MRCYQVGYLVTSWKWKPVSTWCDGVPVFSVKYMLNKNSPGLLKKGAAKQSRIKSIAWHLRWLVRTRADIGLRPSGLVRSRTDIKLRPSELVRSRTDIKLRPSAFVRTRTDFKLQTVRLLRSYKD